MARRTDTVEGTPTEPWVEDGFRWLTNSANGLLTRCPDNGDALGSFYGRGYVDAVKATEPELPAPSADAWVEEGFRLLVHPETSGSNWVPDEVEALQAFYGNGWVDAEKPAPVEETSAEGPPAGGRLDEDGFRVLTHPITGGETSVPNTADALAVFHENGWVDATPTAEPPAQPAEPASEPPPITENPADTATNEKEL